MKNAIYCILVFSVIIGCSHVNNDIQQEPVLKEPAYKNEGQFSPDIKNLGNNLFEVTVITTWRQDIQSMRDELRERAEIEILQYMCLLEVGIETLEMQQERDGYIDMFSSIISSSVYGRIDEISKIFEETRLINDQPYFVMRFKVHLIEEEPDLLFFVSCNLNKTTYLNSDELIVEVTSTKPAYIIVFNFDIEKNRFEILFPIKGLPSNRIQPAVTFSIPTENYHKKIRVYADGQAETQSTIFVIATKEKWSLPIKEVITFKDFKNWLGKIPLPVRAIDYKSYIVYNE